jgi:hypothetical protein
MSIRRILNNNSSVITVVILALIILSPFIYSFFTFVFVHDDQSSQPFLEKPDPKYENCVKDIEYMRLHHWELLRAIRIEVVRYGKRGELGLKKCQECHTSRERFCNRCHAAVSMSPDCYGCHYYP